MISTQTLNQLYDMRLNALARDIRERETQPSFTEMGFDEQIAVVIDKEWHRRRDKRITDLISAARFCYSNASVLDIDYDANRGIVKKQINELAECSYIVNGQNVIIMGATGVGKSYLACALGIAACRNRYACRYVRVPDLMDELTMAQPNGSVRHIIQQYRKPKLLVMDEWLLTQIDEQALEDIFEIIDSRSVERSSTIFCSQIETSEWLAALGSTLIAESLMDRIVHISHKIVMQGDSMRKKNALKQKGQPD